MSFLKFLKNYSWVKMLLDVIFFGFFWFLTYYIFILICVEWELGICGVWLFELPGAMLTALIGYLISFRLSFIKNLKLKITSFFETNKYTSKFVAYVGKSENLWVLGVLLIILGYILDSVLNG